MAIAPQKLSKKKKQSVQLRGKKAARDPALPAFGREKQRRLQGGLKWPVVFWMALIHLGALAAPFTFSWAGLGLLLVMQWLNGSIGICMGYHRLFTHRSFVAATPVKWFCALCGTLAGEGGVAYWVANHRQHHAHSDQDDDPHSPEHGGWWAHMTWTLYGLRAHEYQAYVKKWAPDIARDRVLMFLDRTFIFWHLAFSFAVFGIGYAVGGPSLAWSLVVWGVFLRLFSVLHTTWFVNSASHMWGYRNYQTTDQSRNLWWVALLSFGEGWHNNHHAYPRMARAGHRWWEFDPTFLAIRLLEKVGLVWDVCDGQHEADAQENQAVA